MKLSMEIDGEILKFSYEIGESTLSGERPLTVSTLGLFADGLQHLQNIAVMNPEPKKP